MENAHVADQHLTIGNSKSANAKLSKARGLDDFARNHARSNVQNPARGS
jgi:hypothetical protein